MPKAALLDVDGTLIDSNDAHAGSWVDALAAEGIEVEFARVRGLIGMGGDRLLPAVTGIEESSERGQKIAERRKQIFKSEYLPKLEPFPGVRDLLLRMKDKGLKLVVATSAGKDMMEDLLDVAGVKDLIEASTNKDSVESSKPAPDIVEAALEKAGVKPGDAIMLGDSPYDVEAAARAGVGIVAVLCGGFSKEDLRGARAIYNDPHDLLRHFDSSRFVQQHSSSHGLEA